MWKDWKRKVSNFFFEEVEEEVEIPENEERINNRNHRRANTKVTYQYPKEQHPPFRFPVIPDAQKSNQGPSKRKVGKLVQQRKWKQSPSNKDGLIYGYKGKKVQNEIEEIPAYLRRNKEKESEKNLNKEQDSYLRI